ncbi:MULTISPECIES: ImmA/IrrE family metallo-endopeptidase [Staphylococcus]|uniref:ImmA/IrrE family metallo-endopeptidase n=1 Tax=Staphylococcus TaxID=1279 RepID=UPI001AEBBE34|nr:MULTISPECIES: ImmA/IrrE family metallo-endopeptidase [Staphylococcus]MDU9349064.1 ImmA/IrrE family metallo-endopeptidase [Staphylococcus ureilyticus]
MRELQYGEILNKEIINLFPNDKQNEIENMIVSDEKGFFIDLKEICNILQIAIEEKIDGFDFSLNDSGYYDSKENKIIINRIESKNRKRFTLAHELGHALLEHEGISFRTNDKDKYKDIINKIRETEANKFAAQLLMPRGLVSHLLSEAIKNKDYNPKNLDEFQVDQLIKEVAKKLKVSEESLGYSIKNYELLSDKT